MTEKELKKLNRYQLLEIILIQAEQLEELKVQLEQAKAELAQQRIQISNAGSIAQAALQLSGVFEAAQKAADMYINAVKENCTENNAKTDNAAGSISEELIISPKDAISQSAEK